MEMRWRALQAGHIYVRQHPEDARLTVDELQDMVGTSGTALCNRVVHFGSLYVAHDRIGFANVVGLLQWLILWES